MVNYANLEAKFSLEKPEKEKDANNGFKIANILCLLSAQWGELDDASKDSFKVFSMFLYKTVSQNTDSFVHGL